MGAAADAQAEALASLVSSLKAKWGFKLLREQRELHRVGRLLVLRDVSEAVVERAAAEGTPRARAHAELWLQMAHRRGLQWNAELTASDPIKLLSEELYSEVSS